MAKVTTPYAKILVPTSDDPRLITADLLTSFSKVDSTLAQQGGESSAALITAEQAKTAAAQAVARAAAIEDPIYIGYGEPDGGQELRVNLGADVDPAPEPEVAWGNIAGKPTSFPSTISEVSGLEARLSALTYSTGWRRISPATGAGYAFDGTGSIYFRRRAGGALDGKGDSVDVRFENVGVLAGTAANAYLTPTFWLPPGFRAWFNERSWYLVGNVNANTEYKIGIVQSHRVRLSPESPVPGTGAAALQGTITFPTDDPRPTSIPGAAYTF